METAIIDTEKTANLKHEKRISGLNSVKGIAGPGRPRKSDEERALDKTGNKVIAKFNKKLKALLPKTVQTLEAALDAPLQKRKVLTRKGELVEVDPSAGELHAGVRACEIVQDRVLGKPQQSIEHSGSGAQFNVIFAAQQNVKVEPAK